MSQRNRPLLPDRRTVSRVLEPRPRHEQDADAVSKWLIYGSKGKALAEKINNEPNVDDSISWAFRMEHQFAKVLLLQNLHFEDKLK